MHLTNGERRLARHHLRAAIASLRLAEHFVAGDAYEQTLIEEDRQDVESRLRLLIDDPFEEVRLE